MPVFTTGSTELQLYMNVVFQMLMSITVLGISEIPKNLSSMDQQDRYMDHDAIQAKDIKIKDVHLQF